MPDTTDDFLGDLSADLGGWSNHPADWEPAYKAASAKYGVPEAILKAATSVESSNKAAVTSKAGAQGLAQIMPGSTPPGVNPWNPNSAIDGMGQILGQRYAQTKSWTDALQAYNGGPGYTKLQPGDPGYAENSGYVPKIAAAIKAQGGDPGILTGTQVSGGPAGVASNSTATYTPPKGAATTDDFLNDLQQTLAPPAAADTQAPAAAPAALSPDQSTQLSNIIAHPPQPDVVSPPPGQPQGAPSPVPNGPPQGAVPPQAGVQIPPQSPQLAPPPAGSPSGSAPVQLAPPPPVVNTSDPRWIATHPDEVQGQVNAAQPQDAQIPQPPGSPPLPLPQAASAAAPPQSFTPFTPSGVSPNINPTWDGQKEWANAISLGAARPLASAVGGGIAALQGGNFSKTFAADQAQQAAAQARYEAVNPGNAGLSGVVGPLPAELATGGAVGRGLSALGGPVGRFMAGETGTVLGPGGRAIAAPGAANIAGNVLSKGAAGTLQGGIMGAEGANVSPGQDPFITQVIKGAAAGGGLGLLGGALGRTLLPAVKPAVAQISNQMAGLGVTVPVGKLVSGTAPGMIAGNGEAHALQQYSQAVGRQIGSAEPTLTSDGVDRAMDRIGDGLDAVGLRTGIASGSPQIATPLMANLRGILIRARDNLDPGTPERAAVYNQVGRMMQRVAQGDIDGPQYQLMTQTGSGLMNMIKNKNNPIIQGYGRDIRQVFDQGLEDTAIARGNPEAVQELQGLRNQYRIASAVQPIADKAGATGILNPQAVANKFAGDAPGTPMKILADGGRLLPSPDAVGNPKSAAPALWNFAKHAVLPALVMGGAGYAGEGLAGAGIGLTLGLGAEKLGETAVNSPAYRNMLMGNPSTTGNLLGARTGTALGTNVMNRPQGYGGQAPPPPVNPFLAGQQQ